MPLTIRRRFSVVIAAVASLVALALPVPAAHAEVTKIVVPVNQSPWLEAYKKLVADYTKETGVQVDLRVFPYDQMRSTIVTDIQSGSKTYDVYQFDEVFNHEFYGNNWVKPFNQIDPNFKMDPNIGSYGNYSYWNSTKRINDPKGQVMALPLNGNVQLFLYRKDIYQQLGLKVPNTWAEVLANAKKIKNAGAAKYAYVVRTQAATGGSSVTYDFSHLYAAYGARWFNREGDDWTPVVNSKAAVQAATTFRQLATYGPEATTTIGQGQVIAALQRGEAAQGQVVAAAANQMNDPNASLVVGKIGFAPMPRATAKGKRGIVSGTWALGVPNGLPSDREQAAFKYINWILSKQAQAKFAEYGGIPTRTDVIASANLTASQREYLNAYQEGMKDVNAAIRYLFSAPMLAATEQRIGAIAAGTVTPTAGLQKLFFDLQKVVSDFDFTMKATKATTITCTKGKTVRQVTAVNPKCPSGFKKK